MNIELKDIEPLKKGQLSIFKATGGGKSTIKEILMIDEQSEKILDKAEQLYKVETGFTPREHFHRTSAILTTREERNEARQRFNQIVESLEGKV